MNRCLTTAIALLAAGGVVCADPPQSPEGREPGKRPEARDQRMPGPGRDGERGPGRDGERGPGRDGERGKRGGPHRAGEMATRMMRTLDADQSGSISFAEFQTGDKMAKLPPEARRNFFNHFDKNGDGKIVRSELPSDSGTPSRSGGPGDGLRKLDVNRDGKVSREEFLKSPRLERVPMEKRAEIFNRIDGNHDGFLDGRDHRRGPRPDGMPGRGRPPMDPAKLLGEMDRDKNGAVDFKEFSAHPRFSGMNEDEREDLFEKMDRNDDHKLDKADSPEGPGPRERMRPGPDGGGERRGPPRGPNA